MIVKDGVLMAMTGGYLLESHLSRTPPILGFTMPKQPMIDNVGLS